MGPCYRASCRILVQGRGGTLVVAPVLFDLAFTLVLKRTYPNPMGQKISVLALTGFLGAGKTTLLNRLLSDSAPQVSEYSPVETIDPKRTVVLVNELGEVGLDHHLLRHVDDRVAVLPSGCICCSVKGELVNALRDLFMAAMQRRITPFTHVVIETTGVADPSSLRYTLAFERFLADRYRYAGCVTVVDVPHILDLYPAYPEVQSQLAMADGFALTKLDQSTPDQVRSVESWLEGLFPQARRSPAQGLQTLTDLFALGASFGARLRLFGGNGAATWSPATPVHGQLDVFSAHWSGQVSRPALSKALAAALERAGETLVRFKGLFLLEDGQCVVLHAVHGTAYPPEVLDATLSDCAAIAITRGSSAESFIVFLRDQLLLKC